MELSLNAARAIQLAAQGPLKPPRKKSTKADVLKEIRRMCGLQIDTISVVERSQHLVLWSRLGDYNTKWLEELHADGALFEYYSHAACFLPIEDYTLYRFKMLERALGGERMTVPSSHVQTALDRVQERIRRDGPVRSCEFEREGASGAGWWNWKPEKHALERLYDSGVLMIAKREGFQRVYDLRERVLPDWGDVRAHSADEARRDLIIKAVRALGVARPKWIRWYFYNVLKRYHPAAAVAAMLNDLVNEGTPVEATVDGTKHFLHPDNIELAGLAASGKLKPTLTTLLSPFDPLVRDRDRALELFGFHYRIEVYVPEAKRQHGYFTLPILQRGRLIGRLDPKAHRKQGVFEVKAIHLEPDVKVTSTLIADLAQTLTKCAAWHKTPEVVIRKSDPQELAALVTVELAKVIKSQPMRVSAEGAAIR